MNFAKFMTELEEEVLKEEILAAVEKVIEEGKRLDI